MGVRRLSTRLLLRPEDVAPSRDDFEVIGVFNPGAVVAENEVVLLVRVAERPRERRPGFTGLPRWDPDDGLTIDWVRDAEWDAADPRVVRRICDGRTRLTSASHLRTVRCGAGIEVREIADVAFLPRAAEEEYGIEDPRITPLEGRFYFTYVGVSRHGPATFLASTVDFRSFDRHGIHFCPDNKDVTLFPEKIGGKYAALHRPSCATPFTRPEIWTARSPDLVHWGEHAPLILPAADWRSGRAGAGAPPIRVADGWLEIFHGNRAPSRPGEAGTYSAGAMLLDPFDPRRVLRQSREPLFAPTADFETAGFVPDVVFPTGVVRSGDRLLVYYGAADAFTAVVEFSEREVLDSTASLD